MTTPSPDHSENSHEGTSIYAGRNEAVFRLVDDLKEKCPAQFVLLVRTGGQMIALAGERATKDLVELSALIAADLAASQEIARLTYQYQNYQLILREGIDTNSFIVEAGRDAVLFVTVNKEVPLGWARLLIKEIGTQLADILSGPPHKSEDLELPSGHRDLSDQVGGALDTIWQG